MVRVQLIAVDLLSLLLCENALRWTLPVRIVFENAFWPRSRCIPLHSMSKIHHNQTKFHNEIRHNSSADKRSIGRFKNSFEFKMTHRSSLIRAAHCFVIENRSRAPPVLRILPNVDAFC